ncbi:hypothetical protein [Streptomyces sp. 8N706]
MAPAAVRTGLDAGRTTGAAHRYDRYGRLLQSYELTLWNTLADGAR